MTKKTVGRPSKFTQKLADDICERLANGESLKKICDHEVMPTRATVYAWLIEKVGFSDKYARAREEQAEYYADQIIEIADNVVATTDDISKARVQIDARKWHASKLAPKKFGDKITQEHTGRIEGELSLIKRVIVDPKGNDRAND